VASRPIRRRRPPRQRKWIIATSDVLAAAGTLEVAHNPFRFQQQGGGSGDDGNLVIVETNAQPGARNVVRPLVGTFGAGSARISGRRGRILKGPIPVLADASHRDPQTVIVSRSFHAVSRLFA
jgi:hypothetical protein